MACPFGIPRCAACLGRRCHANHRNLAAFRSLAQGVVMTTGAERRLMLVAVGLATAAGCASYSAELRAGKRGEREGGLATYYSPRLAGHKTANGERYDPKQFTAAHPVIPFGTHVQVTRTDGTNRAVIVRVNDRCKGGKKIIDVSESAARQLDMLRVGIVPVELEVVAPPP
jgi:rare lipoprotein A